MGHANTRVNVKYEKGCGPRRSDPNSNIVGGTTGKGLKKWKIGKKRQRESCEFVKVY